MDDESEIWSALKEHKKAKFDADRAAFHAQAVKQDDGGWKKHTAFHWSRQLAGSRLDYWPSRKKFQYQNKVMRGDVQKFIAQKDNT